MVGRSEDFARARRLAGQYGRPVLFVREDGEEFLITDPETIAEVEERSRPICRARSRA